jgi:mRNA interferase HicA
VWQLDRQGASHEIWRCGRRLVPVPRHKEIGNTMVRTIFAQLEPEIGKDWWRK